MAKLKPRARLIRTIGDKLISGPEAAIIELVKNSYDADSPEVKIKIVPPRHQDINDITSPVIEEGSITISDKGHGMSIHDIEHVWLVPATDEKTKKLTSRSGKRTVLGAKGVGRFATARLGSTMSLTSTILKDDKLQKCRLEFNWDIFEKAEYLEEIDLDIKKQPTTLNDKCGVEIKISNLKTIWTENQLRSLIQELRRLATPQEETSDKFDIIFDLSAFKQSQEKKEYLEQIRNAKKREEVDKKTFSPYDFDGQKLLYESNKTLSTLIKENAEQPPSESQPSEQKIAPYSIGDHCHYKVEGSFDEEGHFEGTFNIVRGDNKPQAIQLEAPTLEVGQNSCGKFSICLRVFDLERDSISSLFERMGLDYKKFTLNEARKFISESTGIGIFRHEFRIRPYGHHSNDWLNLEKRRVQNPSLRIGHGQVYGSIKVSDEQSSNLIERSSREGLEENGSFNRLKQLVTELLLHIEAVRFKFREKAGISRKPKKDFNKAFKLASMESISKAIESVHSLSSDDKETIKVEINKTSHELDNVLNGMKDYIQILESRATLGDVVAELLHEGGGYLGSIGGVRDFLQDFGPSLLDDSPRGDIARGDLPQEIKTLKDGHLGISKLFKDLDPISGRKRGYPKNFSLFEVVNRVERLTKTIRFDSEVFLQIDVDKKLQCFGHEGDLQAALMNLISNATHWLGTVDIDNKLITISATKYDNMIEINVSNNGPIINSVNFDKLFEPGFTMKTGGHGLGLAIAKEAVLSSKGTLYFEEESSQTTFTIKFPVMK
ncbi:sensor histidine kinase [Vibrio sp. D173a]|uniref:sensor histidine kinase n=1 Tax=Vibrio sp. D173a TaxID=2836349 RepID=UPI0025534F6E|nr:sensor histidine kinase [Vibrio sp. D173a]MDK9755636.1 sensor histidine kinase [Vibrio sp. D173a]